MKTLKTLLLASTLVTAPLSVWAESVDINTADAEALASALNGVGLARAQAIIEYRTTHGPFTAVDDLAKVQGIGQSTVDKNREQISVGKSE